MIEPSESSDVVTCQSQVTRHFRSLRRHTSLQGQFTTAEFPKEFEGCRSLPTSQARHFLVNRTPDLQRPQFTHLGRRREGK